MLTLYHSADARSLRCLWLLEELNIPYELKVVKFPARILEPSFLEINPLGTVPYLIDGDTRMNESCAILTYLSSRYGDDAFQLPVEHPRYGDYLNWLHFGEAALTYTQAVSLRYRFFLPKDQRLPEVATHFQAMVYERLPLVHDAVAKSLYLCGDEFTIADISVGYGLFLTSMFKLDEPFSNDTKAYCERLFQRPAFLKAREIQSVR
ncbi:glutathione S-transferase family protein [Zhongshania sp.]|uniref:glutathione S-transferase family protein n=1 Tax=Zhongshania sp. TaxID=1971902 RepID=UPI001B6267EE|nr:glutathione S-transferase family protein [Zhongshania sp.]MBQ0794890.1 glutathione S-transferase family protein [Zhongshania sp.]